MKISKIFLYDEPAVQERQISNLKNFLLETFPVEVEVKECIFHNLDEKDIEKISCCRVFDTTSPFKKHTPNKQEIDFEKNVCKDTKLMENTIKVEDAERIEDVVMYDGFQIQNAISTTISQDCLIQNNLHIIFTNKLTCTYDNLDHRYHGRTVICSNPAIISTTGMIEAPAKSREYYLEAMKCKVQGLDIKSVKKNHSGEFLDYHDQRLSKIAEGCLLQAIFYYITGDAFCDSLDCRLNNAHWQKDLIYSQIKISKLCKKHQKILGDL